MTLKIDVLANDGSPLGVTLDDLWGKGKRGIGIGGSEYALLTVCEGFAARGYDVTLYNDPSKEDGSPFCQRSIREFNPHEDRDILIAFRSPNPRAALSDRGKKIWWSCDQYTIGSFNAFAQYMDKIVCISPFHSEYFKKNYQINDAVVIDIPIRLHDFHEVDEVKIQNRCIFTSVPDRGLQILYGIWPRIKEQIPSASLVITSDYRLWGVEARNESHRMKWMGMPNVEFLGAITRERLISEQAKAQLLLYPCVYDELFCVSVAEAQCLGVYPITSGVGALATTNIGSIIEGNPNDQFSFGASFATHVIELLRNQDEWFKLAIETTWKARDRFSLDRILDEWENKVFE